VRFLADESCDHRVVRALRAAGHDVRAVSDLSPRAADTEVIALAAREARIVLTEDRDSRRDPGWLFRCDAAGSRTNQSGPARVT
jgi:predicted nuclease of predicted toxin-antitoxin system